MCDILVGLLLNTGPGERLKSLMTKLGSIGTRVKQVYDVRMLLWWYYVATYPIAIHLNDRLHSWNFNPSTFFNEQSLWSISQGWQRQTIIQVGWLHHGKVYYMCLALMVFSLGFASGKTANLRFIELQSGYLRRRVSFPTRWLNSPPPTELKTHFSML